VCHKLEVTYKRSCEFTKKNMSSSSSFPYATPASTQRMPDPSANGRKCRKSSTSGQRQRTSHQKQPRRRIPQPHFSPRQEPSSEDEDTLVAGKGRGKTIRKMKTTGIRKEARTAKALLSEYMILIPPSRIELISLFSSAVEVMIHPLFIEGTGDRKARFSGGA
jgi:hypothetical protein